MAVLAYGIAANKGKEFQEPESSFDNTSSSATLRHQEEKEGEQILTASRAKNCTRDTKDRMDTNMRQIRGQSFSKTEESGAAIT